MTDYKESREFRDTLKPKGSRLHTPRESAALFTANPGRHERVRTRHVSSVSSRSDPLRGTKGMAQRRHMSENYRWQSPVRGSSHILSEAPPAYGNQQQTGCLTPLFGWLILAASFLVMLLFLILLHH